LIDTLASLDNSTLAFPEAPISFSTFPDPRLHSGRHFRFIASSCLSPNFPYRGHFNKKTIRGFDLLADYLEESSTEPVPTTVNETNTTAAALVPGKPSTEFLLLLGDFIYADIPVFVGDNKAGYQRLYRRNYQSPSFRRVYEKLRKLPVHFCQLLILTQTSYLSHLRRS
jgi:alkaline phosphatase D